MKLHVYLRNAGIASRRKAEEFIAQGRVMVDGVVGEIGQQLKGTERVEFDGRPVKGVPVDRRFNYYLINKPIGYTSTTAFHASEKSVLELIPLSERRKQWQLVGRLDKESSGLMLLTDNGNLVYRLTHPKFEVEKEYDVTLDASLRTGDMNVLRQGLKGKDGETYHFKRISLKRGLTYSVVLTEGKKHEIREAIGALGGRVKELERIRIAMIMLGSLKVGQYRALEKQERQQLEGLLTKEV